MGGTDSRFEKRNKGVLTSLNSVGIQFVGGIADGDKFLPEDPYSADQFVFLQNTLGAMGGAIYELEELYPTADGKATDKEKVEGAICRLEIWLYK